MKAFLVNRVGDFGFILGIGLLLAYAGSMNYAKCSPSAPSWPADPAGHRLDAADRGLHLPVHRRDG
jgi:NADH:ubiquinone oxidoreductase subunit 5 (subunit L)/multisubunit Na+/H+ antiporter MnhA subunit